MTAVVLRPFAKADLATAPDLWLRARRIAAPDMPPPERGALEHALIVLHLPHHTVLVAEESGRMAGFVIRDPADGRILERVIDPDAPTTVRDALETVARS